ncbi:hypothetical protein GORHZ_119_00500 [Gordonia rhizosphera NBRC 16068]|uniref:Uncharacterized protein n=2 Tax=Gordonia rhizosphera TaxID=83341 RepID=K6WFH5_9ACTN|nr:hypothetical protein GORHZ_119_00500 [Gordonia rhizosphera NBRC 16068]
MREYHRARPGHSSRPQIIVRGIQEEDSRQVPGDLLAEWDILFHPATDNSSPEVRGDVVARRTVRRARHSRTSILEGDSHPVILLATDVPATAAGDVWSQVLRSAERGGTLSDVLMEHQRSQR